ncbi:MAG: hypothetical protein OEL83_19300 [Desulforhopalus sp.]|nr:hypothetical protein [Desulforhopalus sp.]
MKTGKKTSAKSPHDTCTACGAEQQLTAHGANDNLCATCLKIIGILQDNPACARKLAQIAGFPGCTPKQVEQELPDVLDAVRYRTTDRERNTWYVSVSELDGNPVEIFASTAFDRDQHLQSRISNLTTITRLISLILRHVFLGERLTLEKTLTQLYRSSRLPDDLPAMLGKVLANYSKKNTTATDKEPSEQ